MEEKTIEQPKQEISKQEQKEDENIVFVGTKPFVNYIKSLTIQFTLKNRDEVKIKARGKFISKAVDLAEVIKKKFSENPKIEIKDIKTNSEEFINKEGKKVNVSTIEICMIKK